MKGKLLMVVAACGFSATTWAAPGSSFFDAYYVPSAELEIENAGFLLDGTEDGDGFGFKGAFELAPSMFLTGEYQSNEYEDVDLELDAYRIGLGLGQGAGNGGGLYGRLEFINADDGEEDESGGVATLGFALAASEQFKLYGEVGYQKFDDLDGPEYTVGVALMLTPNLGLFADYRNTLLEVEDTDVEISYEDVRAGLRLTF